LIQLKHSELGIKALKQLLRRVAVRTIRLREDDDGVLVDEGLGAGLCGGHGDGAWAGEGAEKTGEDGRNGGWLWMGVSEEKAMVFFYGVSGGVLTNGLRGLGGLVGSDRIAGFDSAMMSGDICQLEGRPARSRAKAGSWI
jgi:hypothetical protein